MTYDKATYTIQFDESSVPVAEWYATEAEEHAEPGVVTILSTEVRDDGYSLIVTVQGNGYAIPVWEEQFREQSLPDSASIECEVDIGGSEP